MHQNTDESRPTVRLLEGEYIGNDPALYGKRATLLVRGNKGDETTNEPIIQVKFDDVKTGLGYGWHPFLVAQFDVDWDFDSRT